MSDKIQKVEIDYRKLKEAVKASGYTNKSLSYEIGRGETFVSQLKNVPKQPENLEKLLCEKLGIPAGSLVMVPEKPVDQGVRMLQRLTGQINSVENMIESVKPLLADIAKKVNANTVQIEKVKDLLDSMAESETERIKAFIKEMLAGGERTEAEILDLTEKRGFKRASTLKAKEKLNVVVYAKGYGSGKRTYWKLR